MAALAMAIATQRPGAGLIHHSDLAAHRGPKTGGLHHLAILRRSILGGHEATQQSYLNGRLL